MEWKSIDLSSKLSFTCGGNVNYYNSVHHPIPICGNRKHQISKLSILLSVQIYSLLGKTERERKAFFEGCKKRDHIVRLP